MVFVRLDDCGALHSLIKCVCVRAYGTVILFTAYYDEGNFSQLVVSQNGMLAWIIVQTVFGCIALVASSVFSFIWSLRGLVIVCSIRFHLRTHSHVAYSLLFVLLLSRQLSLRA